MFGFSLKCLEFPSLEDLVRHYTKNSLSKHNKDLNTALRNPVGSAS